MIVLLLLLVVPIFGSELFSESVIMIRGDESIVYPRDTHRGKGISATIDWGQVPDLGVPKDEIVLIEIINRQTVKYNGGSIVLSPSEWRFTSSSWTVDYQGSIPYLENLEFLSEDYSVNTDNHINITRNSLGYFQDSDTRYIGFYQPMHSHSPKAVSVIHILSAEENQYIYDMSRKLDTQIIQEQILDIKEKPIIIEELDVVEEHSIQKEKTVKVIPTNNTNETRIENSSKTSIQKREEN